ncbi:Uncharacterized protein Fot_05017 [Forsythia ovata]|uniref:Uncharacterized protein n=1 Tax=Forsythia ovata TaxID=205694 RepID=A0ABD1WNY9_9LAMI
MTKICITPLQILETLHDISLQSDSNGSDKSAHLHSREGNLHKVEAIGRAQIRNSKLEGVKPRPRPFPSAFFLVRFFAPNKPQTPEHKFPQISSLFLKVRTKYHL